MTGNAITKARQAQGLTRAELARRTGLTQETLKNAEEGKSIRYTTACAIARELRLPLKQPHLHWIRRECAKQDVALKKLAYDVCISTQYLYNIITGRAPLRSEIEQKIRKRLGV